MLPTICVSGLGYSFPDGYTLFQNISFTMTGGKTGLVGANGCGKTTLLKIIRKECSPTEGSLRTNGNFAVLEQEQSGYSALTLSEVLEADKKIAALHAIAEGKGSETDFVLIGDDWDTEERIHRILYASGLDHIPLDRRFRHLSGGEASRLLFAKCLLQHPDLIMLDEPTNHLDGKNRRLLYEMVREYKNGLLVVSHDRQLLRLMDTIIELTPSAAHLYGGNYDFYVRQKATERNALEQQILTAELELKKEQRAAADAAASRKKMNTRAEKNSAKGGIPKILLNRRRGKGEQSLARMNAVHEKKLNRLQHRVDELKDGLTVLNNLKIDLRTEPAYNGKILLKADGINFGYNGTLLWRQNIDFTLHTRVRISLAGDNGSGKTTLAHLLTGQIQPVCGTILRNDIRIGSIDQKYEIIDPGITILDNLRRFAPSEMLEHELRIRLGRFLFYKEEVFKQAKDLSGGEKCRLSMACLLAVSNEPDLLILDEPTNNLDLAGIEQMQSALQQYTGALFVISHDQDFLESIGIDSVLDLNRYKNIDFEQ
ncbi:MAG: ABC transporter ATP-binding protein [Ignavibacteriae bacterium]|nr:MAG: ABC transporter ATP-binding protein [Ignavibacteriota bacterium]